MHWSQYCSSSALVAENTSLLPASLCSSLVIVLILCWDSFGKDTGDTVLIMYICYTYYYLMGSGAKREVERVCIKVGPVVPCLGSSGTGNAGDTALVGLTAVLES